MSFWVVDRRDFCGGVCFVMGVHFGLLGCMVEGSSVPRLHASALAWRCQGQRSSIFRAGWPMDKPLKQAPKA